MRIAPLNAELVPPRVADGTVAIGRAVLLPLRAGAWPRHVAFPLAAFLLFLGIAAAIAHAHGIRFVLPTEARSPALGFSGTVPVLVAALGYAVALLLARKAAGRDNRRLLGDTLTDLLYLALFIGTSTLYFQLKLSMPLVNHALYDQALFSVDQRLHPLLDGVSRLRNGIAAGLPMADFWYQGAQLGLFILSFWGLAFRRDRRWHQHNVTALLLNLMIGALAYLLVPAVGPFVFEQGQNAAASQAQHTMLEVFDAVRTQGAAWIAAHGGEHFTAAPAAMPSLHLSAALIVIYYTARARSALLPLMVAFGGWIAIEALAARWHYLADLPAGALVAAASIAATNLAYRRRAEDTRQARRPRLALVPAEPRPTPAKRPLVWAVMCYRAGDNAQIRALAERLGWNVEVKHLAYRPGGRLIDVFRGTNLWGIDRKRSSPLEGPWPDLIISASMRNEPVCRWIQAQSGGRARYVHIGKPWADVSRFDLVISAPEFPVPAAPNVLKTSHTLHGVTRQRLRAEAARWAPRLAHLPRPYVVVLLGGYGGPYALVPGNAARLGARASAMARRMGGSLLITTSARTPERATDALLGAVDVPFDLHRWAPDAPENPYFGYLGLADAVIVTCDSTSMLAEACATGKPVYMFDLAEDGDDAGGRSVAARLRDGLEPDRVKAYLYRKLMWGLAPRKITRDIRVVHRHLLATGRVAWLGDPAPAGPPLGDEVAHAAARVRDLVAPVAADEMRLTGS